MPDLEAPMEVLFGGGDRTDRADGGGASDQVMPSDTSTQSDTGAAGAGQEQPAGQPPGSENATATGTPAPADKPWLEPKWRKRFKSDEEAERGYRELQAAFMRASQESNQYRQERDQLRQELEQIRRLLQERGMAGQDPNLAAARRRELLAKLYQEPDTVLSQLVDEIVSQRFNQLVELQAKTIAPVLAQTMYQRVSMQFPELAGHEDVVAEEIARIQDRIASHRGDVAAIEADLELAFLRAARRVQASQSAQPQPRRPTGAAPVVGTPSGNVPSKTPVRQFIESLKRANIY